MLLYGTLFFYVGTDLMIHVKLIETSHIRTKEERSILEGISFLQGGTIGPLQYSIATKDIIAWLLPLCLLDWCLERFETQYDYSFDTTRLRAYKESAEVFNISTPDLIMEMGK